MNMALVSGKIFACSLLICLSDGNAEVIEKASVILPPPTLKKPSFHLFRSHEASDASGINSSQRSTILDCTATISLQLRQIANAELGVATLQDTFNTLPYMQVEVQDKSYLQKMVESLDNKLRTYSSLVWNMTDIAKSSYKKFKKETARQNEAQNLMFDYVGNNQVERLEEQRHYYPCCIIPDNYLLYNPLFGKRVNTELWCDAGLDQNEFRETRSRNFFTPLKLTEMFAINHRLYPSLKWQFFLSSSGIHTEFPAHRPGTSVGSECGKSSRHHHIYESTVRPHGRNIVLLFDLGHALRPRLLLTAKGIGHYVVNTLTSQDNVAVLGVAKSVSTPTHACMKTSMMPAMHNVQQSLRNFIDFMEAENVATNHTLGFERALDIIHAWSQKRRKDKREDPPVLIMYITRGLVVEFRDEAEEVLRFLASRIDNIRANIVVSTYGLGISHEQKQFLEVIAYQQYEKYNIKVNKLAKPGAVLRINPTLRLAPILHNFYEVAKRTLHLPLYSSNSAIYNAGVTVSDPYWDSEGNGMVITLSKEVYTDKGDLGGVVGIDISLSHLLEDVTYFRSPSRGYMMVLDKKKNILSHPTLGRPESWKLPLAPTPAILIESSPGFAQLLPHLMYQSHGVMTPRLSLRDTKEYLWRRLESLGWIFVISRHASDPSVEVLSKKIPSLSRAFSHRLDLLSPQEAKVCRHFNQMATLDGATVFLSLGAFKSPSEYVAKSLRNVNIHTNVIAYLTDGSHLLANPGIREEVRPETSALHLIAETWKKYHLHSKFRNYIIRRYGATPSGVTVAYPGTLLDTSYDPTSQKWFLQSMGNPGKVVVSAPFLDPGGAGYIVTVSHTVYQGNSGAQHSPSDPVLAVLAADFTLGFFHIVLADIEPACAKSTYYDGTKRSEDSSGVRCFLMDTAGYLLAHPAFVNPSLSAHRFGVSLPSHVTHQEPVLSMALLGKSLSNGGSHSEEPILIKRWCGRWWQGSSERLYSFRIKVGQVLSSFNNGFNTMQSENSCLRYSLTAVPSSNLIFGIVNQTCSPPPAFCPCSTSQLEKNCLNCQLMEASSCECPCKCSLPSQPCSERPFPNLPVTYSWHTDSKATTSNSSVMIKQPDIALSAGLENNENDRFFSCPREPEPPGPLPYGIGMLSQLELCTPVLCSTHTALSTCMGVQDCVWCVFDSDARTTVLKEPYCIQAAFCYGGIKGAPSPYPPGLSHLPHSEERGTALPIGPVAGGVLAVFIVMGLSIYCYRSYVGNPSQRANYTPTSLQNQSRHSPPLYHSDGDANNELLDDGIISAAAAATISPYRMNPGYRRPAGHHGDSSDHGYSTMTPHEESEHLAYTDLGACSLFPTSSALEEERQSSAKWSYHSDQYEEQNNVFNPDRDHHHHRQQQQQQHEGLFQTRLSSPKRIGPNKLIVPVTVHMVDTV